MYSREQKLSEDQYEFTADEEREFFLERVEEIIADEKLKERIVRDSEFFEFEYIDGTFRPLNYKVTKGNQDEASMLYNVPIREYLASELVALKIELQKEMKNYNGLQKRDYLISSEELSQEGLTRLINFELDYKLFLEKAIEDYKNRDVEFCSECGEAQKDLRREIKYYF